MGQGHETPKNNPLPTDGLCHTSTPQSRVYFHYAPHCPPAAAHPSIPFSHLRKPQHSHTQCKNGKTNEKRPAWPKMLHTTDANRIFEFRRGQ